MRSCQGGNPRLRTRTEGSIPLMPDDIEDLAEEEEELATDDEEEGEPTAEDLEDASVPPEPGLENVESIQDLLAKQEATETVKEAAD